MRRERLHALLSVLLITAACRQSDPPKATSPETPRVDLDAQKRADEFRWKERCAIAAARLDPLFASPPGAPRRDGAVSISEAFYSPTRNTCICEIATTGKGGGKYGRSTLLELSDCLTRELLGSTLLQLGAQDYDRAVEAWKRKNDALR
jgi:hypothetical protein